MKFFDREKFAAFVRASGEWKRAKPDFVALSMEEMQVELYYQNNGKIRGMKDGGECQLMSCFVLFDGCGESVL